MNINHRTITIPLGTRVIAFWSLLAISVLSIFVYIYAVNIIARNTAVRQNLEQKITDISTKLNSLEFSYIDLKNNVTLELAHSYGFSETEKPLYISRDKGRALSFNTLDR